MLAGRAGVAGEDIAAWTHNYRPFSTDAKAELLKKAGVLDPVDAGEKYPNYTPSSQ